VASEHDISTVEAPASDALTQTLMRAGLNLIGQALSIYDADLRLAVCNARFGEMFDLPDALVSPGASFADTIRFLAERGDYGPIDDLDAFVAPRVEQARAFEPHYMERRRANGRWISVEGAPLPQGGWITVYTDITATRAQEELLRTRSEALSEQVLRRSEELSRTNRALAATVSALEETQRQLRASEARTRQTTEMMPAHIAHVDAAGRYTYSNRRLSAVIPGRPSEIVGLHISEALGPSAFAQVHPALEAAYAGRSSTFEFTDGPSQRRIRTAFTPDTVARGAYILSMDVTEETQARAALQQARRRETATQLTSGLVHDFSNLLTIILGMQTKLAGIDALPLDAQPLIEATLGAARRGGALLGHLGDMTGGRAWQPRAVPFPDFLDDLATLARSALPPGITFALDTSLRGEMLLDPGMLSDALLNLVLNARDACGASGHLALSAELRGETWLDITLADTGPGFSEDALARAFEPFFSTKGGEGTGLGLVMVYDMAKLAGGDVRLANTGRGARVTLRLPYRPAPSIATEMVLLVEDNPDLRDSTREMLTALGHQVIEASSVAEARALAASLPEIDRVLSDIVLEGAETGLDLAAALPELPCLLMTSLPRSDPRHAAALARGPVLRKPFDAGLLRAALAGRLAA
jgi:signal transduction histidine kinase